MAIRDKDATITALFDNASNSLFIPNGNVGIGISVPLAELQVVGPAGASGEILVSDVDEGTLTTDSLLLQKSGIHSYIRNQDSGNLYLGAGLTNHLTILGNGNVGIGTTSPAALTHLYGADARLRIQDDNNASSYFEIDDVQDTQVNIQKVTAAGGTMIDINPVPSDGTSTSYVRLFRGTNTSGARGLQIFRGDNTATIDHALLSGSSSSSYLAANGGNVGIGTTSPTDTLHIKKVTGTTGVQIDRAAGEFGYLNFTTAGSRRWHMGVSNAAESGSNAGSNFYINRATDAGVYLDTPLQINRATGKVWVYDICDETGANCKDVSTGWSSAASSGTAGYIQFADGSGGFSNSGTTAGQQFFWDNTNKRLGIGTATPSTQFELATASGQIRMGTWSGGAIDTLLPGSTAGSLIEGTYQAHLTFGIRDNDAADSFSIVSGGGNYNTDTTYDTLILYARADGKVGIGNSAPTEALTVTGSVDASVQFLGQAADTVTAPSFSWTGDTNTGFFRPAADTVAFTTNGTEAMRINANNQVGIGTTAPAYLLDIAQTSTATSGTNYMKRGIYTVSPATASTGTFEAAYNQVNVTGSNNVTTVNGTESRATHGGTATVTNMRGAYNFAVNSSTGTITNAFGSYNDVQNAAGATITNAHGAYHRSYSNATTGTGITTNYGSYSLGQNNAAGAIGSNYGSFSVSLNNSSGAVTSAFGTYGRIDNASTGNITTGYSLRGDLINDGGGTVGTWYGLYIASTTGVSAGAEWPIYVVNSNTSYMAGGLSLGDATPTAGASLDMGSKTDSILLPLGTDAQRPGTPVEGMFRYNTTSDKLEYRDASGWQALATATGSASSGAAGYLQLSNGSGGFTDSGTTAGEQLFWNNTTKRLGIGNVAPTQALTVTGSVDASVQFLGQAADTVSAPSFSWTGDTNTGFFRPAADTVAFTTNGTEAMRIDSGNRVGIGVTPSVNSKLDVRDTKTDTTGTKYGIYNALTITPTAASTATMYAGYSFADVTGANDASNVQGQLSYARHNGTALVTTLRGSTNQAYNSGGGNVTNGYGAYNLYVNNHATSTTTNGYGQYNDIQSAVQGGVVTTGYGSYSRSLVAAANTSGTPMTSSYGSYGLSQNASVVTLPTSVGLYGLSYNTSTGTITTGTGVYGRVDNNSTGTITTAISVRADLDNAGTIGTWYGLYVPASTGAGTTTTKWPLYIADANMSYMATGLSIGDTTPTAGASLDMGSKTDSILLPLGTDAQRPGTPVEGMFRYNTTSDKLEYRDASGWQALATATGSASSGAAGYLQLSNGSGGFTDSGTTAGEQLFWNNTTKRLGIGNAAPTQALTVTGSVDASVQFLGQAADTITAPSFSWTGDTNTGIFRPAADTVGFTTNGTEAMRINASNNVGIGTTSPNAVALLDVASTTKGFLPPRMTTAQVNAIVTPPDGLLAYDTDTDTIKLRANGAWVSVGSGGGGSPSSGTSGYVQISDGSGGFTNSGTTAGQQFFWNNTTKRLGIGNAAPGYPLDVTGSVRSSGEFISTNANQFRMVYGSYGSFLRNDGSATYLLLTASADQYGTWNTLRPFTLNNVNGDVQIGNNAIYVQHGGFVGINGVTAPGYNLDVAGSIRATTLLDLHSGGATGRVGLNSGDAGNSGYVQWFRPNGTTRIAYMGWGTSGANNLNLSMENSAFFQINGGNVGIGIAPTQKFHVSGNALIDNTVYLRTTGSYIKHDATNFSLGNSTGSTLFYNSVGASGTSLAYRFHATTSNTNVFEILNNGTVKATGAYWSQGYAGSTNTGCGANYAGGIYYGETYCYDLAESYATEEKVSRGEIVSLGTELDSRDVPLMNPAEGETKDAIYASTTAKLRRADAASRGKILGIVSSSPMNYGEIKGSLREGDQPLALKGRVPVRVSLDGGDIEIGDPITVSDKTAGVGMKATTSGRIVGYALQPFNAESKDKMIDVFVQLQDWRSPEDDKKIIDELQTLRSEMQMLRDEVNAMKSGRN